METGIVHSFFLIFAGAAVLATLALSTRQPLLVAYIVLGALLGPHGLQWVSDARLLAEIAEVGIIFLLFLVGLDLKPSRLKSMLGEGLLTGILTTLIFFGLGFGLLASFGYTLAESIVCGVAVTFSSTILGIKLLPTTVLHHRHVGEIVVSLLLIQDFIAIIALIAFAGIGSSIGVTLSNLGLALLTLPLLIAAAFVGVRWILTPLLRKFDAFHEFIFLVALGWCLGFASLAEFAGLSLAIGAFIAGVSLANSPIAPYITEHLKPLRDFFLVLFFFSVGAGLDIGLMLVVAVPTLALGLLLVAAKPVVFAKLLQWQGEPKEQSWEVGFRLGQTSEFSLLLSYVAVTAGLLGEHAAHIIQGATVLTLLLSSYLVIFRYPSPIAINPDLRRD